uniref:Protein-disulfide isomerase n=1 Tax=Candidatus Kentrum sp. LPFa TaxID=2126335 RepID=A0A450WLS8_9GAMM|nr:MAG: Protein-disulfide isomerase [Candidatus Kentron sp. LPFa]
MNLIKTFIITVALSGLVAVAVVYLVPMEKLFPRPVVSIATEGFPVKGNPDAPVTIVEFGNYLCGHCKEAVGIIDDVMQRFEGKVKVVYMDLPFSEISRAIAQGGACANKQGKFWAWHDLAFRNQESLNKESPETLAWEIGLDENVFAACLASGEGEARVKKSEQEADRLGLDRAPSTFVNGRETYYLELEQAVAAALLE